MKIRGAVDSYSRKTKQYIVAYLDILGATSRINDKSRQDDALNLLHNLYTMILELASKNGIKKYADIKFKIFSDNIIIAKEICSNDEKTNDDILILLNCVSNFLCSSVGESVSWLIRGGITIGDFYIDDTIVWGAALVRAYELEDKIAFYPRVVLDNSIVNALSKTNSDYLRQDTDGLYFLNYMSIWSFSGEIVQTAFEKMKSEAIQNDGTYPDKIFQKLCWHKNYVNRELDLKNEKRDRKFRLTI